MNNKGQGLSITTIVIAAIALLILVVLVAVFTGQIGDFSGTVEDCQSAGGQCEGSKPGPNYVKLPNKECDGDKDCYTEIGQDEEQQSEEQGPGEEDIPPGAQK